MNADKIESLVNGFMAVFGFAAMLLIMAAMVFGQANAASSVVVLNTQMQSECFANMVKSVAKPSQASKFCRSIYGK